MSTRTKLLWVAVLSATQDIAIDAYTIELLDKSEISPASGLRVTTYRVALIAAGGFFVALAGWIGWRGAFSVAALLLAGYAVASSRAPSPEVMGDSHLCGGVEPAGLAQRVWAPLIREVRVCHVFHCYFLPCLPCLCLPSLGWTVDPS